MPYFKENQLLYLHVPKTGGMSIEEYFFHKYSIEKNERSIYGWYFDRPNKIRVPNERSLQHFTYKEILQHKQYFHFDIKTILISVRNPYDRMISEMFWNQRINLDSTPNEVADAIYEYLYVDTDIRDNHKLPQSDFCLDLNGNMLENIQIVKTETLERDMFSYQYTDFNLHMNICKSGKYVDYKKYLNHRSLQMIQTYYGKDFEMFGYSKDTHFNATIVTAFVGNVNKNKNRTMDEYIDFGKKLLKIPNPKIVFIDYDSYQVLVEDDYPFTTFIPMVKEDIYLYNYKSQITNFFIHSGNSDKDSLEYLFVQCNKTEWVSKAIDLNKYKTEQFIWIDFGIYHMIKEKELFEPLILSMTEKSYDSLRIASCKYKGYSVDYNVYEIITWTFAGSIFGGNKESLLEFAFLVKKEILNTIREKNNLMWEINIWYLIYRKNLDFFNMYTCGHDFRILEYY
jgi:hypothetical protein